MFWVFTKSSPLEAQPFAALKASLATELYAPTTACFVSLTAVMVSVYGVPLLPILFPAAASMNTSKSGSAASPASGWSGISSSTVLPVTAVYTRVSLASLSFIVVSFLHVDWLWRSHPYLPASLSPERRYELLPLTEGAGCVVIHPVGCRESCGWPPCWQQPVTQPTALQPGLS